MPKKNSKSEANILKQSAALGLYVPRLGTAGVGYGFLGAAIAVDAVADRLNWVSKQAFSADNYLAELQSELNGEGQEMLAELEAEAEMLDAQVLDPEEQKAATEQSIGAVVLAQMQSAIQQSQDYIKQVVEENGRIKAALASKEADLAARRATKKAKASTQDEAVLKAHKTGASRVKVSSSKKNAPTTGFAAPNLAV